MFERIRGGPPSLLAIVLIGYFAISGTFAATLFERERESINKETATHEAYEQARSKFQANCLGHGLSDQELVECLEKQVETAREPERSEEDLEAQKQMAFWTRVMGLSGFILGFPSLAVAAAALFFANRAWREARRSANTAEKHLTNAERPWLSVKVELASDLFMTSEGKLKVDVRFILTNSGTSPATNVLFEVELIPDAAKAFDKVREKYDYVLKKDSNFRREPDSKFLGMAVFPGETKEHIISMMIREGDIIDRFVVWPTVVGSVPYVSTIDNETHQTGFVAYIYKPDARDRRVRHAIHLDNDSVPANELEISTGFVTGVVD